MDQTMTPTILRRLAIVAALVVLAPLAVACTKQQQTVTLMAAASLKTALSKVVSDYSTRHPDVTVRSTYAGSSSLVSQLSDGASTDILVTADTTTYQQAVDKKLIGKATIIATNTLVIVTPAGNPAKVTGMDASLRGTKLVICAAQVPCGRATVKLAGINKVTLAPVSQEQKVTDVLGKVTAGEADCGVVYQTDAKGAGSAVTTVPIANSDQVVNRYPAGLTSGGADNAAAKEIYALITGEAGRAALQNAGFGAP